MATRIEELRVQLDAAKKRWDEVLADVTKKAASSSSPSDQLNAAQKELKDLLDATDQLKSLKESPVIDASMRDGYVAQIAALEEKRGPLEARVGVQMAAAVLEKQVNKLQRETRQMEETGRPITEAAPTASCDLRV